MGPHAVLGQSNPIGNRLGRHTPHAFPTSPSHPASQGLARLARRADHQHALLAPFSQTSLRTWRFASDGWCGVRSSDAKRLPWLSGAPAVIDCAVETEVDYGTHTLFIGRVTNVRCGRMGPGDCLPLVWLAGQRVGLTPTA